MKRNFGFLYCLAAAVLLGPSSFAAGTGKECEDELRAVVAEVQSRPWVGLEYHYIETGGNRFLLTRLQQDGPAATAGLRRGDVILSIDGVQISGRPVYEEGKAAFRAAFGGMKQGKPLHLAVERDGKVFKTDLVPGTPEGYALAEVVGRQLLMTRLGMIIGTNHREVHSED